MEQRHCEVFRSNLTWILYLRNEGRDFDQVRSDNYIVPLFFSLLDYCLVLLLPKGPKPLRGDESDSELKAFYW